MMQRAPPGENPHRLRHTLSQLFAEGGEPVSLPQSQPWLLNRWSRLSRERQAIVFALIDQM